MNYTDDQIEDACERLEELAPIEGSEYGEYLGSLARLWGRIDYCDVDEPFRPALAEEIMRCIKRIDDEFEVVDEVIPVPATTRRVRELRFKQ